MELYRLWLNEANQQFELYDNDGRLIPGQTESLIKDGWGKDGKQGIPQVTITLYVKLVNTKPTPNDPA